MTYANGNFHFLNSPGGVRERLPYIVWLKVGICFQDIVGGILIGHKPDNRSHRNAQTTNTGLAPP